MPNMLYYIHDPMCSWCYAFRSSLALLKQNLPKSIEFRSILGGLAPDSDVPMGAELRQTIQQSWRRIEQQCADTHFNFDFWTNNIPRRSTYPSCRAVLVAQQHGLEAEMIAQIQHAYYQAAQNPSDEAILCDCAHAIGLDPDMFRRALHHPDTEQAFVAQRQHAAKLNADVFPSLRLDLNGSIWPVEVDYHNPQTMLDNIELLMEFD